MNKQKKVKGQGYVIKMKLNFKYAKNYIRLEPFCLKKKNIKFIKDSLIFISNYLSLSTLPYACFSFVKKILINCDLNPKLVHVTVNCNEFNSEPNFNDFTFLGVIFFLHNTYK